MGSDSVADFYNQLASEYHRLFADWRASVARQARVLDGLLRAAGLAPPCAVLDAACGIGTQALGLAALGYRVHATDLSAAAVARARAEAQAAGLALTVGVADLRRLAADVTGEFDVALACDNALPHLLTDAELARAAAGLYARLRPGGLLLASIRDYDRLARERPRLDPPRVFDDPSGRRIAFQLWDWAADGRSYALHQFIVQERAGAWHTRHYATTYRALRRAELTAALRAAGFQRVRWHAPRATGYHQPIVTARRPLRRARGRTG